MADKNIDWQHIDEQMRNVLLEMMCNLRASECETIREFVVLKERTHLPGVGVRFALYEMNHNQNSGGDRQVGKLGVYHPISV